MLYFSMAPKRRWVLLLIASYYFYMSWKAEYAILIFISTIIDYYCGLKMGEIPKEKKSKRKKYLYLSLLVNLGMLFTFKYFNFFNESISSLLGQFQIDFQGPVFKLLLPVGISFYTFQTLSYTIDIYNDKLKPSKNFGKFALFVSFFPQLVAGPIERAKDLLPQFDQYFEFDYERAKSGLLLMCWGFFKKLVIADRVSIFVNMVFENPEEHYGLSVMLASVLFSFQVYCDFSGYSDIAIGAALVMGFKLMDNFKRPFFSTSMREFWTRWHISLSFWLRDYIYIPLGGSKLGVKRQYLNLMILFTACGLWHGASWTFVLWGASIGIYVVIEHLTAQKRKHYFGTSFWKNHPKALKLAQIVITYSFVCFTGFFFRGNSIGDVLLMWKNMFLFNQPQLTFLSEAYYLKNLMIAIGFIGLMESVHLYQEFKGSARLKISQQPLLVRWAIYAGLIFVILNFGILTQKEFIYFQF
ncbi:MAG: MBOAT family O-acyltransferase [Chitinophagales bacterium]